MLPEGGIFVTRYIQNKNKETTSIDRIKILKTKSGTWNPTSAQFFH